MTKRLAAAMFIAIARNEHSCRELFQRTIQ